MGPYFVLYLSYNMYSLTQAIKLRNELLQKKIVISNKVRAIRSIDMSRASFVSKRQMEMDIKLGLSQMAELEEQINNLQKVIDYYMDNL